MTQAIRLLSSQPFSSSSLPSESALPDPTTHLGTSVLETQDSQTIADPFTHGALTYTTTGTDIFPAPSAYLSRRHSWVHIFPEGRIHQHPLKSLRYFKWGVSRLILESEPLPDIVAMFVDGNQAVMHESREFPRFLPRIGKQIRVAFGEKVDGEKVFGDLREQWKRLVGRQREASQGKHGEMALGELTEGLMFGAEAVALREECTRRVRKEVLKVRRSLGLPDEDPKQGLVETWIEEGSSGKREGKMDDGSWVKDT